MGENNNPLVPLGSLADRKTDHITLAVDNDGFSGGSTWLEFVKLIHNPLSDLNFDDLSTSFTIFGKKIESPVLIDAITGGGTDLSKTINSRLAITAEKYKLPLCVGSQRILLENPNQDSSFRVIRENAPSTVVFGNIGFAQIGEMKNFQNIDSLLSIIEADALCIHLNPLQEMIQYDGNRQFSGSFQQMCELQDYLGIPVVLKEVGAGFSREFVALMAKQGFLNFNVAGYGGTNFALIEGSRAESKRKDFYAHIAETFADWGIPTAASILEAKQVLPKTGLLIASGGIRTGLDIAKSLSLGADICGIALAFLEEAVKSQEAVDRYYQRLSYELQMAMMLTGSPTLQDLQKTPRVILPPLENWASQRNLGGSSQ
ncbi:MAG: type 2 isopentenyl-diphosphate Delta-isomerase [Promethearchaeota archaeon]